MGRLQQNIVMPPNTVRRADRARKAKDTINKAIPELLRSSPRARHGVHKSVMICDPSPVQPTQPNAQDVKLRIRVQDTDTLTAARRLTQSSRRASLAAPSCNKNGKPNLNVCILNMASPLRPGGGFLDGATSQEEFLCMRTTLYPSLWDEFYRLPEVGGVVTPDVLVFRDSTPDSEGLGKRERFFVDVITSAMIRFPETNRQSDGDDEKTGCSCGVSYCDRDRELVTRKMRAVLRMAQSQGSERLVLGAWGCGAYGNPVREVAKIWKRVLCGTSRKAESWPGIKEIVFAINDKPMLREFEHCFAGALVPASNPTSPPPEISTDLAAPDSEKVASDQVTELVLKIQETEMQLDQISNPRSKARLRDVLADLNKRLSSVGASQDPDDDIPLADEDEEPHQDEPAFQTSYPEDSSYYHFDSSDVASSGTLSPASTFEFKFHNRSTPPLSPSLDAETTPDDTVLTRFPSREQQRQELEDSDGWFAGSINGLSALLNKSPRGQGSPVLRPESLGADVEELNLEGYLQRFASQEH